MYSISPIHNNLQTKDSGDRMESWFGGGHILATPTPPEQLERWRCNFLQSGELDHVIRLKITFQSFSSSWSRHSLQLLTTTMFW